jgi:DNA-binding response OmpR family regulator
MRILVVEDSEELADLLAKGMQAAGYGVDLLTNVADASSALETNRYAALILDLGLPDGDGLSILRELRHRKDPIPVLILTARGAWKIESAGSEAEQTTILSNLFHLTSWWRGSKRCSGGRGSCSAAHCGLPT